MEATLTELHRKTGEILGRVKQGGQKVIVTDQGKACAQIVPRGGDRKKAMALLASIGPLDLPPRK